MGKEHGTGNHPLVSAGKHRDRADVRVGQAGGETWRQANFRKELVDGGNFGWLAGCLVGGAFGPPQDSKALVPFGIWVLCCRQPVPDHWGSFMVWQMTGNTAVARSNREIVETTVR